MKKIVIGLMIFVCLALVIGVCSVISVKNGYLSVADSESGGNMEAVVYEHEFDLEGINQIEISYISEKIKLYSSDNEKLVIKEYLNTVGQNKPAIVNESNSRISVKSGKNGGSFLNFLNFPLGEEKIEVYLPQSFIEKLSLSTVSGSISSDQSWELDQFQAGSTSGSINIAGVSSKQLDLNTVSGSIKAGNLTGKGSIGTTSGSVKIQIAKVEGDFTVSTVSGSVKVGVPESAAFQFKAHTVSGRISTFFPLSQGSKKNVSASYGEGGNTKIDLGTVSGSITVETNS